MTDGSKWVKRGDDIFLTFNGVEYKVTNVSEPFYLPWR